MEMFDHIDVLKSKNSTYVNERTWFNVAKDT